MQRGEVAVASACAASTCNQFVETTRSRFEPEHSSSSHATSRPSSISDDGDGNPPPHHQYQPSLPLQTPPNATVRRTGGKHRKYRMYQSSAPCVKFATKAGCHYGDKCRFSHDVQGLYPAYYGFVGNGDLARSGNDDLAMSTYPQQPYQRLRMPPATHYPLLPRSEQPGRFPSRPLLPQRERASSFASHLKARSNQRHDEPPRPVSPNAQLLFKEAVLQQNKLEQMDVKQQGVAAPKKRAGDTYSSGNQLGSRGLTAPKNGCDAAKTGSTFQQQPQRRRKVHGCMHASDDGFPNYGVGDSAESSLDPNYLFSEAGSIGLPRATRSQQQLGQRQQQQQSYPHAMNVAQLMHTIYPSVSQYVAEEQFYSGISRQAESIVDSVDTQLAAMEMHQQQAIDSLQELVRSLWPDALIDVYGSNYTRLALPMSDIDCVLVSRALIGERPLAILEALASEMERQPWTKRLELLGSAKIPVLKIAYSFDSAQKDVLLDLTCGHSVGHSGLSARDLIYSFQAEMPALRPLVVILKSHILCNDLNCAFTGGLSSYVLVVLAIRFLQACGDTHHKSFASNGINKPPGGNRRRSFLESASAREFSEEFVYSANLDEYVVKPKWCYTFSRDGRVTWRTGIGNLLMLFLETYITFDYRRFGISIDNGGEFFLLPPDKVISNQCSVVIPYVADPIKPGRSICNCFRMHEVIQSWFNLYQNLASGISVATCIARRSSP